MPTKPRTKYRTKPLLHYLDELTTEEVVEMFSTLDMRNTYDPQKPLTIEEHHALCCTVLARIIADQIPPAMESELVGLLSRQIIKGWWPGWEEDFYAVNSALFGTGLVSVNRFDTRVRLHQSLLMMTAAPADTEAGRERAPADEAAA